MRCNYLPAKDILLKHMQVIHLASGVRIFHAYKHTEETPLPATLKGVDAVL